MPKDINIHVKTPGADQAKRNLNDIARSGKKVGGDIESSSNKAATATGKSNKKLSAMSGMMGGLTTKVSAFVSAFLGIGGVIKLVTDLNAKLDRTVQLQKDILDNSLQLAEVGQALEIQTGTTGKQHEWTTKAVQLQEAGGLRDIGVAKDMMISMDIAMAKQGGIKNPHVMDIGKQIAPFVGANQMTGAEVTKLFEFATTAKVDPTADAYKEYLAKLQAGYTSSKATSFGQFMTGLQQGGTPYIAQGGSLDESISAFASARAVAESESVAANLLKQVSRFSSGAYEKPRKAVEQSQGVKWGQLEMDERMAVLLSHIAEIPESSRTQVMVEQGFEPGLATEVQKMVTPEARSTMQSTRRAVTAATSSQTDIQMQSFLQSNLAKHRQVQARKAAMDIEAGPEFAAWQRRVSLTGKEADVLISRGEDRLRIPDKFEKYHMIISDMRDELSKLMKDLSEDDRKEAGLLDLSIGSALDSMNIAHPMSLVMSPFLGEGYASGRGYSIFKRLQELKQKTPGLDGGGDLPGLIPQEDHTKPGTPMTTIYNTHYHSDTIFNPRIGSDGRGPRYRQDNP